MLGKARALKRYSRRQMGRVGGGGGGGGGGCSSWLMAIMFYFGICYCIAGYISGQDISRDCHPDGVIVFLVAVLLAFFLLVCFLAIDFIVTRIKDK